MEENTRSSFRLQQMILEELQEARGSAHAAADATLIAAQPAAAAAPAPAPAPVADAQPRPAVA